MMRLKLPHGIVTKKFLSIGDISAIQNLAAICETYEHTRLRISWSMLQTRPGDFPLDFLYYDHGQLVGYIALDNRGVETKELFGMVHPAYRRRGIFRSLFHAAKDTCRLLGVRRLVLVCERSSDSARAFVKSVRASYDFSEHEMALTDFSPRRQFDDRLSVRLADADDIEALAYVQAAAFGDPEVGVRQHITSLMTQSMCRYYIVLFGEESVGCEEPIGSLRLEFGDELALYAFAIRPAYQGRGYGRQVLEEVIHQIRASQDLSQKAIVLDVETDNLRALSLYHSCGFQVRATYDYYNCYIKS